MAKELDVQTKIIKSVRKDGGYGRKMSNRFTIGVPDLLIGLYPFAPCYVEVKDLGACVDKFDRQIGVTPKQAHEMRLLNDVYHEKQTIYTPNRRAALIMVAIQHLGKHRLVALPATAERLDAGYQDDPARWVERGVGGYYNVAPLLEWAGICKVKLM